MGRAAQAHTDKAPASKPAKALKSKNPVKKYQKWGFAAPSENSTIAESTDDSMYKRPPAPPASPTLEHPPIRAERAEHMIPATLSDDERARMHSPQLISGKDGPYSGSENEDDTEDSSGKLPVLYLVRESDVDVPALRKLVDVRRKGLSTWDSSPGQLETTRRETWQKKNGRRKEPMAMSKTDHFLPALMTATANGLANITGPRRTQAGVGCTCFTPVKDSSSLCTCGFRRNDPCHSVEHTCQFCGEGFTALSNGVDEPPSCTVHSGQVRKVGAGRYAWSCCLQRPAAAASAVAFKALNIPHFGYHIPAQEHHVYQEHHL